MNPSVKDQDELKKIAKNAGISTLGTMAGNYGLAVASGFFVIRFLGIESYGIYDLVTRVCGVLASLSNLGFSTTALRLVSRSVGLADKNRIKGTILFSIFVVTAISTVTFLFVLLFPEALTALFENPEDLTESVASIAPWVRFSAITIVLTALYGVLLQILSGLHAIAYKVYAETLISQSVKLAMLIGFFLMLDDADPDTKMLSVLTVNIIQDLIIVAASVFFLVKAFPALRDAAVTPVYERKETTLFAFTYFTQSAFYKYGFQLDVFFLKAYGSFLNVGLYAVAQRFQVFITATHLSFNAIFAPMASGIYASGDRDKLRNLTKIVTKWVFTISWPIFLLIVIHGEWIATIFSRQYSENPEYLRTTYIAALVCGVGSFTADFLGTAGFVVYMVMSKKTQLINSLIVLTSNVILYFILIPRLGVLGAALTYSISLILSNLILLGELYYLVRFTPFTPSLYKPFVSGLVAGITIFYQKLTFFLDTPMISAGITTLEFVGLYAALLTWFRFDETDRFMLSLVRQKFSRSGGTPA